MSHFTLDALRHQLADSLGQAVSEVHESMRLVEDLGIDSLAMHALLIDIEEAGGIIPSSERLEGVLTVSDLYAAVTGGSVS